MNGRPSQNRQLCVRQTSGPGYLCFTLQVYRVTAPASRRRASGQATLRAGMAADNHGLQVQKNRSRQSTGGRCNNWAVAQVHLHEGGTMPAQQEAEQQDAAGHRQEWKRDCSVMISSSFCPVSMRCHGPGRRCCPRRRSSSSAEQPRTPRRAIIAHAAMMPQRTNAAAGTACPHSTSFWRCSAASG